MATQVQFRGGTTTEHASFNGAAREVTVDTTKQTVVVQNGSTNGGFPLLGEKNADNVKLHLGGNGTTDNGDLILYHDSSHSFIDHNGAGNLYIRTLGTDEDITIQAEKDLYLKVAAGDVAIKAIDTGAVELYNDGSVKLATSGNGVSITGAVESSTLNSASGTDLTLNAGGANRDVFLKVNGTTLVTVEGSTGKLLIGADGTSIKSNQLKFSSAGAAYIDHSTIDQDVIFRVSNNTNGSLGKTALVLKPTGRCGMGTDSPSAPLHVVGSDNNTTLLVESTDSDANVGPIIELFRNSSTPADNDVLGRIDFKGEDNAGNASTFAQIEVTALDEANGSEDGRIDFTAAVADTLTTHMSITGGKVGIGTESPANLLSLESSAPVLSVRDTAGYSAYSNGGKIYFQGKDSNGAVKTFAGIKGVSQSNDNGSLRLQTRSGGTLYDRVTLSASGQAVFTGEGSASGGSIGIDAEEPFIRLYDTNGTANKRKWDIRNVGAGSYLQFRTVSDNNGTFATKLKLSTEGDVEIEDGNLVLANNHGIDFSASESGSPNTNINSLLDDYEEGDWDPLDGSGGSTLTHNHARYTKIGNFVHVDFDITNSSGSALSNIYGLPFAPTNYATFRLAWVSGAGGGAQNSETNVQGGMISTSVNTIGLRLTGANATVTMADTVRIIGSGTYRTA